LLGQDTQDLFYYRQNHNIVIFYKTMKADYSKFNLKFTFVVIVKLNITWRREEQRSSKKFNDHHRRLRNGGRDST